MWSIDVTFRIRIRFSIDLGYRTQSCSKITTTMSHFGKLPAFHRWNSICIVLLMFSNCAKTDSCELRLLFLIIIIQLFGARMTPSGEGNNSGAAASASTFNAHDSASAWQSTDPSFDLVSLPGICNRAITSGEGEEGQAGKLQNISEKSNWSSCRQKQPCICCHHVYHCGCNYFACEAALRSFLLLLLLIPLPLLLLHSCMIMFCCPRYRRGKCAAARINK